MAYLSILRITTKRDADGNADVLRNVAGVSVADIPQFLGCVAFHLSGLLNRTPTEARALLDFDLGDEVECKPLSLGREADKLELRGVAHRVAYAIAPVLTDARSAA